MLAVWRNLVRSILTSICRLQGLPFKVMVPGRGTMTRRASPGREVHENGSSTTQQDTALPSIMGRNVQDATTRTGVISAMSPIGCRIAQRPSLSPVARGYPQRGQAHLLDQRFWRDIWKGMTVGLFGRGLLQRVSKKV